MRLEKEKKSTQEDLTDVYLRLLEEYENVFMEKIDDVVYIYRALSRGEYRSILKDDRFDGVEKEDIICETCVLWPKGFEAGECDAGVPTILTKAILRNSYLDSLQTQINVLTGYRNEMWEIGNQITCLINEAFPSIDIEEIDNWSIDKTLKYLSRAEWKLKNLRNMDINPDYFGTDTQAQATPEEEPYVVTEELGSDPLPEPPKQNLRGGQKKKFDPEELARLKAKYPEIPWEEDAVMKYGRILEDSVDTAPALRTP